MTKWQYKMQIVECHLSPILHMARWVVETPEGQIKEFQNVEAYINKLGEEKWELVSAINGTDQNGTITKALLFFRRPRA